MRILIVEDERALCDTLAKSLRRKGYEADVCYDGDSALASGMEQSYIDSYVRYYTSPGWLAFILLYTTLMGFLGCMVGGRLIRRHFQKAGVL